MKRIAKIVVGITMAATLAAGAGVLAGCTPKAADKTGEAYGLVHGAGYVGYSQITTNGDSVKELTLTEVCLPTQVKAGDDVAEADKVNGGTEEKPTYYYKKVSYGSVTLTYDATAKDYKVGETAFKTYLESEANCKAYYEAVKNNAISVTVGAETKKDVMTYKTLSKEENGYWTKQDANGNSYSRWKVNRDATVKYVKDKGLKNLKNLTKSDEAVKDSYGADAKYWMDGTVSTGATWNDFNPSDKGGKVYYTYAELILKANEAAK